MEHTFSVEIISRNDVRQVILSDPPDSVLFEGTIGELEEIALVEDASLEIKGTKGVIRIDLTRTELGEVLGSTDPGGRG